MYMSPHRSRKNADLAGTNLYYSGKYLYYQNPITGKRIYMTGKTRNEAIQLAHLANKQIPEQRKKHAQDHIPDLLDRFITDYLPLKEYAPATHRGVITKLNKIKTEFDGVQLGDITVITLRDHLEPFGPHSRKHNRLLWIDIYKYALSEGLCEANLAERTLTKKLPKRQRQRLTLQQFNAIYELAPDWFQLAMLTSLLTLQRRNDLVKIRFSDYTGGILKVIQCKTNTGLKITANEQLDGIFKKSKQSGLLSPYLLHKRPEKVRRDYINKKEHWTQLTPELLTRTFKKYADKTKLFDHTENQPTWYEIKSLGGRLLIDQGYTTEFVQQLMGHQKLSTTMIYLGDGIEWKVAKTGLKI